MPKTPSSPPGAPVLRFAPSPNGELHLGHAYSAILTHDLARRMGGRFLLRMEDIDTARCRPDYEALMIEDLAWLGLRWETPVRRQSENFVDYEKAIERLQAMDLLYPCFATRGEIAAAVAGREDGAPWPRDPDGALVYPGLYKAMEPAQVKALKAVGRAFALRLDMDKAAVLAARRAGGELFFTEGPPDQAGGEPIRARMRRWGDVVIARKDVPTSYHLAVTLDDALQGVTHVTRGADLFASTGVHRLLQVLLDLPRPHYHHHRLITGEDGRKLSKSSRDTSLRSLRHAGASPADIRRMVGL